MIEHLGLVINSPFDVGQWYIDNLGFSVVRAVGDNTSGAMFLADSSGRTMLELIANPDVASLDFPSMPNIQFHLALVDADPIAKAEKLVEAGAKIISQSGPDEKGEILMLLADPWGMNVQLVNRGEGNEMP